MASPARFLPFRALLGGGSGGVDPRNVEVLTYKGDTIRRYVSEAIAIRQRNAL